MTLILSGTDGVSDIDGTAATPAIRGTDANTGIFFPAADTIAFAEGGAEAMRIDSSGNVGIGVTPSAWNTFKGMQLVGGSLMSFSNAYVDLWQNSYFDGSDIRYVNTGYASYYRQYSGQHQWFTAASGTGGNVATFTQAMTLDASGNLGIGSTSPSTFGKVTVQVAGTTTPTNATNIGPSSINLYATNGTSTDCTTGIFAWNAANPGIGSGIGFSRENSSDWGTQIRFYTHPTTTLNISDITERARITSGGVFCVGKTASALGTAGFEATSSGETQITASQPNAVVYINRLTNDGDLIRFYQDTVQEGSISVSGNTVSYNAFAGGHWTQLPEGRGYNPDILRGTIMSTIGEMCEWKSVVWDEVIEHPAVPAVEAKEAVLDEEGNVIEPAVEAVEGKDAWTETFNKREAYLGQLPVGATFEEDGVTKTVVDDGNERLPKVKISDVVGDKAVYGVFQTWDEVQDMLVTSLGAFVVRIAAGVTVQIGDLLESNGDGCAKVQDDDVIRSKTIGKVTSITPSATYADGSYTVPCVIYCG